MPTRVWVPEEDLPGLLCASGLTSGDGEAGVTMCAAVAELRHWRWAGQFSENEPLPRLKSPKASSHGVTLKIRGSGPARPCATTRTGAERWSGLRPLLCGSPLPTGWLSSDCRPRP